MINCEILFRKLFRVAYFFQILQINFRTVFFIALSHFEAPENLLKNFFEKFENFF
jgi:hypothetical protein